MRGMDKMDNVIASLFLDYSCRKLENMTGNVRVCLGKLKDAQIWERHGAHENSVGNLVLHLCGNMRQWVIAGVGGALDVRRRDEEFSTEGGMDGEELMGRFSVTVDEALKVIAAVPASRLAEIVHPQGHTVSVLDAIYQVVGHVQQHVGQIILLTKQMTATDLDLTMPRPR
jgi:Protein of unknown function (DUF1572)